MENEDTPTSPEKQEHEIITVYPVRVCCFSGTIMYCLPNAELCVA